MKRRRALPLLVLVLAVAGCGSAATLSGKVTYRGRPVTSGTVIVLQADGTAKSWVIEPDGTYTVQGIKRGRVKIGVLSPHPARARSVLKSAKKQGKAKAEGWFPLPAAAGDPEKSGLACDVTAAQVQFDINLK
jgi:hypothetical protein